VQTYLQINQQYFPVLADEIKVLISSYASAITTTNNYALKDVENAEKAVSKIQAIKGEIAVAEAAKAQIFPLERVDDAARYASDAKAAENDAAKQAKLAISLEKKFPYPNINSPVDGLLHSVQFVVTYGVNVSPNWTLLQWKGPGLTVPGASASGVRTHVLNIALGPPNEQNRLIQNQTVTNASHP
jgi:hypothetical protein